ncbi:hypothetical protein IMZ48_43505 [Candidatus Bathyarchaeota archaeon]|nr:hypothetical protein [Candidatus Bathyarchaeota archaeon]
MSSTSRQKPPSTQVPNSRSQNRIIEQRQHLLPIRSSINPLGLQIRLRIRASLDSRVVGPAGVAELVADPVDNYVRVESFLLVGGDGCVGGLEGELVGRAPAEAALEDYGGVAGAKVGGSACCGVVFGI